jgi:hypothetical protein
MTVTVHTAPARISAEHPEWQRLKAAAITLRELQVQDGSIPDQAYHAAADGHVEALVSAIEALAPAFPHDSLYLDLVCRDFGRWAGDGYGVPDFLDSLLAFQPQADRENGLQHLVVFPMYTQNGSSSRLVEAVLIDVVWPDFIAGLEQGDYSNRLFVPIRFIDFTPGYDTNSAVLFPETVGVRATPRFTWGAIFADREAARFRRVLRAAADLTSLEAAGREPRNSSRTRSSPKRPSSCGT